MKKGRIIMTIKEAREFAGLTQVQVEEEFGVPVRSLQNWEKDIRQPPEYVEAYLIQVLCQMKKIARIKVKVDEVVIETLQEDEYEIAHSAPVVDGKIPASMITTIGRLSEAGYKLVFVD